MSEILAMSNEQMEQIPGTGPLLTPPTSHNLSGSSAIRAVACGMLWYYWWGERSLAFISYSLTMNTIVYGC